MAEGDPDEEWYRQRAIELFYRDGELEIDPGAVVSMGADNGAYVQCWVWVENDQVVEVKDSE